VTTNTTMTAILDTAADTCDFDQSQLYGDDVITTVVSELYPSNIVVKETRAEIRCLELCRRVNS